MKKIKKLKLNRLGEYSLDAMLQNTLRGGACGCLCAGCSCLTWRGVGTMSPVQANSDIGVGSTTGHSNSNGISA